MQPPDTTLNSAYPEQHRARWNTHPPLSVRQMSETSLLFSPRYKSNIGLAQHQRWRQKRLILTIFSRPPQMRPEGLTTSPGVQVSVADTRGTPGDVGDALRDVGDAAEDVVIKNYEGYRSICLFKTQKNIERAFDLQLALV